jgi:hypothetical protein
MDFLLISCNILKNGKKKSMYVWSMAIGKIPIQPGIVCNQLKRAQGALAPR